MAGSLFARLFPVLTPRNKTDLAIDLDVSTIDNTIDQLRSEIINRLADTSSEKRCLILGVTSCEYGEGGYQTASRLADSFSLIRNHVLLIDLDFHHAQLSKALCSVKPEKYLNDILVSGNAAKNPQSISSAVLNTENSTLDFLPASSDSENPSGLLESLHSNALLNTLALHYDVIVCSFAPAMIYADAKMTARDLDAIVFSVREDYTKREHIDSLFSQSVVLKEKTLGFMYYKTK